MNILNTKFKKLTLAFLVTLIAVYGGYWLYENYVSEEGIKARETDEMYRQAQKALDDLEEKQRNDTYGGKTPQETLDLFIEALRVGDVELASKYFWLNEKRDDWRDGLQTAKDEGRLPEIVEKLSLVEPAGSWDESRYYGFELLDEDGVVDVLVEMTFNEFSGVWKIESL